MSRDTQLPRKKTADVMLIDSETGTISIDGVPLPWWFKAEPTVEAPEARGLPSTVTLSMRVERVLILRPFEEDLKWIRELGERARTESVDQFRSQVKREAKALLYRQLADPDARRAAQLVSLRSRFQ